MKLKKFLAGLVALATVSTIATGVISGAEMITLPAGEYIYGDVNLDGSLKSNDLLLLKMHLIGLETSVNGEVVDLDTIPTADLTHDGSVKSNDLLQLKKVILGLEDEETFTVVAPGESDSSAIVDAAVVEEDIPTPTVTTVTDEDGNTISVVDVEVVSEEVILVNAEKILLAVEEYSTLTDEEKVAAQEDIENLVEALMEVAQVTYSNLESVSNLANSSLVTITDNGTVLIDDSVVDVFENAAENVTNIVNLYNSLLDDPDVDLTEVKDEAKKMLAQCGVTIDSEQKTLIMDVISYAQAVMSMTGTDLTAEQLAQILAQ